MVTTEHPQIFETIRACLRKKKKRKTTKTNK